MLKAAADRAAVDEGIDEAGTDDVDVSFANEAEVTGKVELPVRRVVLL
jgi:hypothetical protein